MANSVIKHFTRENMSVKENFVREKPIFVKAKRLLIKIEQDFTELPFPKFILTKK